MKNHIQTVLVVVLLLVVASRSTNKHTKRMKKHQKSEKQKSDSSSNSDISNSQDVSNSDTSDDSTGDRAPSRDDLCQQYIDGVHAVVANTVFPRNLELLSGGPLPDIFLPDVKGRAQPLGSFSGFNNTLEYFYALTLGDYLEAAAIGQDPIFVNVESKFRYVVCDVDQRLGIFSGTLNFGTPGVDTADTVPPENVMYLSGAARFNTDGKVCSYELNLARFGMFVAAEQASAAKNIIDLCLATTFACTGENQQYDSFEDCVEFMTSIDYGTFDNADLNTVSCRRLHTLLALSRPKEHCPHVGKEGGGKCIDRDYANVTEGDYLLGIEGC